ncbi:MAG: urea transporter [Bacteroidetes bacterium]|nr:urea transporter [Bacteroidota bacterium]
MKKSLSLLDYFDTVFKGIGQIMLQENRWTGILFFVGLLVGSWPCAIACLLASIVSLVTAQLCHYNVSEIKSGLYGFSPSLVGVALTFFYQPTGLIWFLIVIGSMVAAMLQHFFLKRNIPVFTLPFIIVSWGLIFMINKWAKTPASILFQTPHSIASYDPYLIPLRGFGQVIFQGHFLSGAFFVMGVLVNRPVAALYGLLGALLGAGIASGLDQNLEFIYAGLFSFNTVLTAIVFAGNNKSDMVWVMIGIIFTILIQYFLVRYHLFDVVGGVLTFPFVAGTWFTLILQQLFLKKA